MSALHEAFAAAKADDRAALGIGEPALERLIRASYQRRGDISFLRVGGDECRTW